MARFVIQSDSEGNVGLIPTSTLEESKIADVPSQKRQVMNWSFGNQSLIRLAGFAVREGFEIINFGIADEHLNPIDRLRESEVSALMVEMLETYGAEEVNDAMFDEFDRLYVTHFTFLSQHTRNQMSIQRNSIVEVSSVTDEFSLLNLLVKARTMLHL